MGFHAAETYSHNLSVLGPCKPFPLGLADVLSFSPSTAAPTPELTTTSYLQDLG